MIWIAGLCLAFAGLYWFWVRPKLAEYRATLGIEQKIVVAAEEEQSFWSRILLHIKGLKTVIVGMVGSFAVLVPVLLENLGGVDMTPFLGADWGGKVTVAMALATTVTHMIGVVSSAKAEPVDGSK